MGQYCVKKEKYTEKEEVNNKKKWYTDSSLTLITGCLSFITFLLSATACYSGNLRHLAPYDLNADFCGSKDVGEERQYLYYPDPHNPIHGICVESCPTGDTGGTLNIPDGFGGITVHPITASELVSGQYCFQPRIRRKEILLILREEYFFLYFIIQDIFKSTEIYFSCIFICILLSILSIKALINKKITKNISLISSFSPLFFSLFTILLSLYHFFTPRILSPGLPLFILATTLTILSLLTGAIPLIFPKTYTRSRQFMLIGAQALEEMPDLLTLIIVINACIGITCVWTIWIIASILSIGPPIPLPLIIQTNQENYMGILSSFPKTPAKGISCIIVIITFILQYESTIIFTKYITTRCVKKWFAKLPKNGLRAPSCDYLLPVCLDIPKDWGPLGAATFFSPICRLPSLLMQMFAAECSLVPHTDTLATYLQSRLYSLNDCLLFHNQLLPFKLDDEHDGYLEAALAGYVEITQGKVEDHYQSRRYFLQELLSPAFQVGFFSTMSIFIAIATWIGLEMSPIFNNTGEKALDSIPVVVIVVLIISILVLSVLQEAINAASCACIMCWSKAATDVLWCDKVNSDTLPVYESKHLRKFLDLLRRKCDRQILF